MIEIYSKPSNSLESEKKYSDILSQEWENKEYIFIRFGAKYPQYKALLNKMQEKQEGFTEEIWHIKIELLHVTGGAEGDKT